MPTLTPSVHRHPPVCPPPTPVRPRCLAAPTLHPCVSQVLGCAFAALFANNDFNDVLLTNATSSLCNGLSIALDGAVGAVPLLYHV